MNKQTSHRTARSIALSLLVSLSLAMFGPVAMAQSQDGSVAGRTEAGATVTVVDPGTGFNRTVVADDDGDFRFPFLPVGEYTLEATKDGASLAGPFPVTVSLGKTTVVNASAIDEVQVVGSRTSKVIDLTSTESATNLTQEQLDAAAGRAGPAVRRRTRARRSQGRFRRPVLRRFVGSRKRRLHQRLERHRFLPPHRLLVGAVLLLRAVPGQDRRLLGRVRPDDGRRDQHGHPLRHERIRVRRRSHLGTVVPAKRRRQPFRCRWQSRLHREPRRIREPKREPVRGRPDRPRSPVLLCHVRGAQLRAPEHR